MKYEEIKDTQVNPYVYSCFFAFSNKQFEEGKGKAGIAKMKKYIRLDSDFTGQKKGYKNILKRSIMNLIVSHKNAIRRRFTIMNSIITNAGTKRTTPKRLKSLSDTSVKKKQKTLFVVMLVWI